MFKSTFETPHSTVSLGNGSQYGFFYFLALNDEATLTLRGLDVSMLFSLVCRRLLFSQEQAQVNKRLKELQRRHNEFRHLLLGGQGPFSAGPAFLTSSQAPFVFLGSEGQFGNNPVSVLYTSSLWLDSFFCLNDSKLSIKRLNQHFFERASESLWNCCCGFRLLPSTADYYNGLFIRSF